MSYQILLLIIGLTPLFSCSSDVEITTEPGVPPADVVNDTTVDSVDGSDQSSDTGGESATTDGGSGGSSGDGGGSTGDGGGAGAPTATISGEPSSINNSVILDVTVAGTEVTHYRYMIGLSSIDCGIIGDYQTETSVANKITADISALADGDIKLCVIGRNSSGTYQDESSSTTATWTKDTIAPTASISGEPTGTSNTTILDITVSGIDVTHYRYKAVISTDDCSTSGDYEVEAAVGTKITANISSLANGGVKLCVIGRDTYGNYQDFASATEVTWTKDTGAPVASISGEPTGTNNINTLDVNIGGVDVTHYRYKVVISSDDCSTSGDYEAEAAVGTKITADFSGLADGGIKLCVVGRDSTSNYQAFASATEATWTKDTQAPTASISNSPSGTNNTVTLNVTIGGAGVTHYRFKIGISSIDCSTSGDYEAEAAVATKITSDISGLADGGIKLCVIGRDSAGNYQTFASASNTTWTKDMAASSGVYGSGVDGDVTISSAIESDDTSLLPRTLAASRRISAQAASGANWLLSLTSSYIDDDHYSAGDEVMWIALSAGDSSSCKSSLGSYGFANVVSVNGSSSEITIDDQIPVTPDSAATTSTSHCLIQLVRVPHFNNLELSSTLSPAAYSSTTGTGGVLVLRTSILDMGGATGTFSAEGKGFKGGTAGSSGQGVLGSSDTVELRNGSGGGGVYQNDWRNYYGAGGGANGGNGDSNPSGGQGGSMATSLDIGCSSYSGDCAPANKLMMGGGGGGGYAELGGDGGGIIIIFAKTITNGSLVINVDGTDGETPSVQAGYGAAAGGAGGSVYINSESTTMNSDLTAMNIYARGGDAPTNNGYEAGGGGGGIIGLDVSSCPSSTAFSVIEGTKYGNSGTVASGASAGTVSGACP